VAFGSTIHSIQGQTLDKACVFLGNQQFAENLFYVALSRTRNIEDLIILDSHIALETFRSPQFFKGLSDQREEYRRLGIYNDVIGDDTEIESSEEESIEEENDEDADSDEVELPTLKLDSQELGNLKCKAEDSAKVIVWRSLLNDAKTEISAAQEQFLVDLEILTAQEQQALADSELMHEQEHQTLSDSGLPVQEQQNSGIISSQQREDNINYLMTYEEFWNVDEVQRDRMEFDEADEVDEISDVVPMEEVEENEEDVIEFPIIPSSSDNPLGWYITNQLERDEDIKKIFMDLQNPIALGLTDRSSLLIGEFLNTYHGKSFF
jgi:hypothetical protein